MATFIPWPHGIQLCLDFTLSGQQIQFCVSLRKSSGDPTPTDLQDAAGAGADWWANYLKTLFSHDLTCRQARATDMHVQNGPEFIEPVNTAGDNVGDSVPANAAVAVSLRTDKRGRSYRGRNYVAGFVPADQPTPTTIGTTLASALVDAWVGLNTYVDALGFDLCVVSRQHNGVPTNPAEMNDVSTIMCDTAIDSQRRRLYGRGS